MSVVKFRNAIKRGDLDKIKVMIAGGLVTPGTWVRDGHPAVFANECGHHEVTEYLLRNGWSFSVPAPDQTYPPLTMAIMNNDYNTFFTLLHLGADPNEEYRNLTPLRAATRSERANAFTARLLAVGARITVNDVLSAASSGNAYALKLFMDAGANPNAVKNAHYAGKPAWPLSVVANAACAEVLLAAGADPLLTHDAQGVTALHELAGRTRHEVMSYILNRLGMTDGGDSARTSEGLTPLMIAAGVVRLRGIPTFRELVRLGASITVTNAKGQTALDILKETEYLANEPSEGKTYSPVFKYPDEGVITRSFLKEIRERHAFNETRCKQHLSGGQAKYRLVS